MRINHNISAQLANVNLKKADSKMSAALERLSSGYKINKAADDSAGMAISNKMRTQIRALNQASRNGDDGVSVIQTAEGALSEIENILQRTRELAVQAANDTNTIEDRKAVQEEIDALLDEVDRIAGTTEYNGKSLLDGTCSRVVTFDAVGMDCLSVSDSVVSGTYSIKVDEMPTFAEANISIPLPGIDQRISINGTTIEIPATMTTGELDNAIVDVCDKLGFDVSGNGGIYTLTSRAAGSSSFLDISDNITVAASTGSVVIDNVIYGKDAEVTLASSASCTPDFSSSAVSYVSGENICIKDSSGFEMNLSLKKGASKGSEYTFTVYDAGSMTLQIGANEHQTLDINFSEVSCRSLKLREADGDDLVNVCSGKGATQSITVFDDAIRAISAYRSSLGAYENRLNSTVGSLDVGEENITEAMSRIMDTDMATAMTEYTQYDVLTQAATSILAQANNRPQTVMSLLKG